MKLTKLTIALAFGMVALGAQSAYAAGPDDRALYEMLQKSSMIRADGALTPEQIKRLLDAATPI